MSIVVFARRNIYLWTHPLALGIGISCAVSGALFILAPSLFLVRESPIGIFLPGPGEWAWALMRTIGGVFITYGILRGKPRFEASGCMLAATVITLNGIALFSVDNPALGISGVTIVSLGLSLFARGAVLVAEGMAHDRR